MPDGERGPMDPGMFLEQTRRGASQRDACLEMFALVGDACLHIPLYATPAEKAAREEPRETITYDVERQADIMMAPAGRAGTGSVELRQSQAQRLSSLSCDDTLERTVAFGTAPALIDRLGELREELSITGIADELNPGGLLPTEGEVRSLEILTKQVMPALE